MEKLTQELIEAHMCSFIETHGKKQGDGVVRYAWGLTEMATGQRLRDTEFSDYKFESAASAQNFAIGWIRRNKPNLEQIAKNEAIAGIKYRASKRA